MMARDAAHATFVHTLEALTAMVKADPAFPVPTEQTVLVAHVADNETVKAFADTHHLGKPGRMNSGRHYVDVPFGLWTYRIVSRGR